MGIIRHLPNFITCLNLLCGCIAIYMVFEGKLIYASYLVGIAAVLDFLDGLAARALKAYSEIGKQLDSLADMVSFGAVPGFIMFKLLDMSSGENNWIKWLGFFITVLSAIRLAKFNIDTRQTESFIGVPTPANAILIASLPLIGYFQADAFNGKITDVILNSYFLVSLTFLMSYLLVAELPLFSLKFKNLKYENNKSRFNFLALSFTLLITFKYIAIPIIIFLYIIFSMIENSKKHKQTDKPSMQDNVNKK